ncbi:nucleoside-diphosphate-sugar epimerase [Rivularia sp. PCC 7116]|uniref:SDR family oxidoreductase n=1 Tax=Rivularia sp. PCC 7116 TaxID=373994 RepID=UPI00029F26B6|nr:SDR family oxidoreductase [Rivularia sp. PCC 7116]AFY58092.1 nucleoside-diphosphate-sugar epimerase [Rivularia sp. PCC 7116]
MDIKSTETEIQQQNNSNLEKIAILGCGYVGTAASSYWYKQGYSVTVTTTRQERVAELENIATKVVVMKGQDSQAVKSLLQDRDTVVLSIAPISNKQVDAEVYRETYIPTAKNLVAALQENKSVKQLIYLSSVSVYGNKNGEWVDEASPVDTESEYNQVLCEAEQLLLNSASEDVQVTILRLGGIYGAQRALIKRFGRLAGKNIDGSGETFTSWIHLDDVIAAMDYLSQRRLGGIYNLVNDFDMTIRELSDEICQLGNLEKIIWDDTKPSYRSLNARISNEKIKAAGYKLIHPQTIS